MPSSQRLTIRQADAQDRHRRFTKQREDLTRRIRKEKKSAYLARKRQFAVMPASESPHSQSSIDSIQPLIKDFCNTPNLETLKVLHDALQVTSLDATEDNWLVVLPPDDLASSSALIQHLLPAASTSDGISMVLSILVRLTSITFAPLSSSSSLSYYGHTPLSWSTLLCQNVDWMAFLVNLAPQSETACIVLGNLVGEANTQSFVTLREAGFVQALVAAIHQPTAAWALTNAIRHDTTEYARVYCNDQALTPALLEQLLKEKPVATQAAWMLAILTSREEQVVHYLLSHPTFANTMIECMKRPVDIDQLAPLVQAMGNIATCSTMEGGAPFSGQLLTSLPPLTPMLGQLLQIPTNREVVQQAAWLAGCLLLDAGIPNHPATTIAAPVLVPLLFQELRDNTPHSLPNQRELAGALCNALTRPEAPGHEPSMSDNDWAEIPLPSWDLVRPSIATLAKLTASVDVDGALTAINVLQILLRRTTNTPEHDLLRQSLEHHDLRHILETLCDSPNAEVAEIAANLLDDYFYVEDEGIDNDDSHVVAGESSFMADQPFAFGLMVNDNHTGTPRGMGRGREATRPSWMLDENFMQPS